MGDISETPEEMKKFCRNGILSSRDVLGRSEIYSLILLQEILSIFGNLTFEDKNSRSYIICNDRKIVKHTHHGEMSMPIQISLYKFVAQGLGFTADIALNHTMPELRFISCDKRGLSALPFSEFVSVFDTRTWLFLAVVIISTLIFMRRIHSRGYLKNLETLYGFLLGISIHQTDQALSWTHFRLVLIPFVFATLVLNTYYRGDNMYRIVEPRRITPFTGIGELVGNGFTIFSRIQKTEVYRPDEKDEMPGQDYLRVSVRDNRHTVTIQRNVFAIKLQSEVFAMYQKAGGFVLEHLLYNFSKPHFFTMHFIASTIRAHRILNNLNNSNPKFEIFRHLEKSLKKAVLIEDDKNLKEHLIKCNRSAVILPSKVALQMIKYFTDANKKELLPFVDIGKEIYFQDYLFYQLSGIVPEYLDVRLKSLKSTGVLEWWQTMLRTNMELDFWKATTVTPASMTGNILVVFVVFVGGLLISTICFVVEKIGLIKSVMCWLQGNVSKLKSRMFGVVFSQ